MAGSISAIICVDREIGFLAQALESIGKQSRPVDEVIMIISDATPKSLSSVIGGIGPQIIERQSEPGLAAARNQGVALSSGEVITFLDADDVWTARKTEIQAECLNRQIQIVVGQLRRFRDPAFAGGDFPAGFFSRKHPAMTPGGMMIARRGFQRIGPFNTRYRMACDHEWFVRMRQSGIGVHQVDDVILEKRIHSENLSHDMSAYRKEIMDMLRCRGGG
jgi:glycosyltransferase involved in cell wall biosynthesis